MPAKLQALDGDTSSYIFFSGDMTAYSDDSSVFDFDITDTSGESFWYGLWDYSSIALEEDLSTVSYDSDSDTYSVSMVYSTSSSDGNVFANYMQQWDSTTEVLEIDSGSLSVINSTFLNTVSDEVYLKVEWSGSASGSGSVTDVDGTDTYDVSINSYSTDSYDLYFFTPPSSTNQAYTYTITQDDTDVAVIDTSDSFSEVVAAFEAGVEALEDSGDAGSEYLEAVIDIVEGVLESAAAETAADLLLSDKDTLLADLQEALDLLNTLSLDDYDADSLFSLELSAATDVDLENGNYLDDGDAIMSFLFDSIAVDNEDEDFLEEAIRYALIESADASDSYAVNYDLSDDDIDSLIDLLNLSVDEDNGGVDTQGAFELTINFDEDTAIAYLEGEITDPTIVPEPGRAALLMGLLGLGMLICRRRL